MATGTSCQRITRKGRELAMKLNPSMGTTPEILQICSLICLHATTYARLCEEDCNEGDTPERNAHSKRLETRIADLAAHLPLVDGAPVRARFQGDPRGSTVCLVMPDGRYDTWGGAESGLAVPGA